ncbi:MAG: cytochrome c maturation protein CcmE [Candidatus Zixiibacteriota bacterium]
MKAKYIIGSAIILVFIVWGAMSFMQTTVQYVEFETAAKTSRTVQVMGKIDFDVVSYDVDRQRLEFAIYDPEAERAVGAERLNVVYYGVVPGNFDQATSVVLKGKPDSTGMFVAEQMLVKCPSKYQGEGGEYQDMRKHQDEPAGT